MLRSCLVSTAAAVAFAIAATAQSVPTGFVIDTLVSSGLAGPNDFCFLPDGRVLLANRAGGISIYAGAAVATIGTVANIDTSLNEEGLLSIQADPAFNTNGYIYVWYNTNFDNVLHLERFTCTGVLNNPGSTALTLDLASRRVVLQTTPDNAYNHNGGSLRFGPDGMLYLSMGDDATGGCPSQLTTSSLGCVMRMNVAGLAAGGSLTPPAFSALDPGDNPLSANTDVSQLVIANGLRNPFRMEIDQVTGNLYIGDVGQVTEEEYSEYVYPAVGALPLRNFGWPWREGTIVQAPGCAGGLPAGLVAPIAAVGGTWASVMGGPRYRNQGGTYDFGAGYEGSAFYLDYYAGELRRLVNTGTWVAAPAVPGQPSATNWGTGFTAVTALRQGPDGALWFSQHSGTSVFTNGSLKRLRPVGPTPSITAISGTGQLVNSGAVFTQPVVVRVFDPNNNPLPGGQVNFAVSGPATLSTTNPVIADANGFAQTTVTSSATVGGSVTVTATTPGALANATFSLFVRRLTVTPAGPLMVVGITNQTAGVPANIAYLIMMSFPHTPVLPTMLGPLQANPFVSNTLILEDGFNHFPRAPWAGTGGIGNPNLSKVYTPPAGLLTGYQMTFQALGLDPVTGFFLTNAEVKQF